jgi:hypothetical protein
MYGCADDFDEFLIDEDKLEKTAPAPTKQEQDVILSNIKLSATAAPPADRIDDLCEIDVKFKATYQNKRDPKSFPKGKASPSEYALSLASIAVQAGWTDQEIADLIIDWNRRHGHDLTKAMRGDYIARTLAVAKKGLDEEFLKNYEKNIEPTEGTKYNKDVDPEGENIKRALSILLGFKLISLTKIVQEKNPHFIMRTDKKSEKNRGEINFYSQDDLMKKPRFESRVFAEINHVIDIPTRQWKPILKKFTAIMIIKEEDDGFLHGRMKAWICEYLESKRIYTPDETAGSREPFVKKGHWHIYEDIFSRWCYNNRGHLEGVPKTKLDLVLIGAEKKKYNIKNPSKKDPTARTTCRAYKIPHNICKPPDKLVQNTALTGQMGSDSDTDDITPTVH